jgi:hypothetical protein
LVDVDFLLFCAHLKNKGEDKRSGVIASLLAAISAWQLLKKKTFFETRESKKVPQGTNKKTITFWREKNRQKKLPVTNKVTAKNLKIKNKLFKKRKS